LTINVLDAGSLRAKRAYQRARKREVRLAVFDQSSRCPASLFTPMRADRLTKAERFGGHYKPGKNQIDWDSCWWVQAAHDEMSAIVKPLVATVVHELAEIDAWRSAGESLTTPGS